MNRPAMDYQIKLDIFQGPLDLLLHLIEQDEIDIYNIPIALITERYLDYLHTIQLLNLEGVGDFLIMAASLMQIKARMLLPNLSASNESEADQEIDPRWELAQKLIEYKKIKEAAKSLQQLEGEQLQVYTRSGGDFPDQQVAALEDPLKNLSLWDLMEAFKTILESLTETSFDMIPKAELSVKQRMVQIQDLLAQKGKTTFQEVFRDVTTRIGLISCFLAVLELLRLKKLLALQSLNFGEIILAVPERVGNPG